MAVHVTSLLCEVGMMAIYIISSIALREEAPPEDGATSLPGIHADSGAISPHTCLCQFAKYRFTA